MKDVRIAGLLILAFAAIIFLTGAGKASSGDRYQLSTVAQGGGSNTVFVFVIDTSTGAVKPLLNNSGAWRFNTPFDQL